MAADTDDRNDMREIFDHNMDELFEHDVCTDSYDDAKKGALDYARDAIRTLMDKQYPDHAILDIVVERLGEWGR